MNEIEYQYIRGFMTGGGLTPDQWQCTLIAKNGKKIARRADTKEESLVLCKQSVDEYDAFESLPVMEKLRAYATEGNERWHPYKAIQMIAEILIEQSKQ